MKLFIAFAHNGQDSQPLIGVSSTRDGALKLIMEHDILEDHIDAGWINHIWDIPEEEEEKKHQLSLPKCQRAYFITEKTLDVLTEWSHDQLIRADGEIIPPF